MNILFAASEVHPLIKTGGLADVAGYLPRSLRGHGASVHIIMPAYRQVLETVSRPRTLARYRTPDGWSIDLLETRLPGSQVKVWLVACPELYDRSGGPYQDGRGVDWPDNALRFAVFARAVVAVAMGWLDWQTRNHWPVDLVHCHDWQTGLIPALLRLQPSAPPSVFTIHNLAYQGVFPYEQFQQLVLPPHLWSHHALEFHGQLCFIKGGIVFADRINTVSPRYAREIRTREFGCGLEGLLQYREDALEGILNGIDTREWNPGTDPYLAERYNRRSLHKKALNKQALQKVMQLPERHDTPLFSVVTRLTHQKGVDLIIDALPEFLDTDIQFAVIGTGDRALERKLLRLGKQYPDKLGVHIAYDEARAHLAIGGGDAFLMPSRFEPCGLTQLYSLRYGTVPVVHNVGGLADTIIDANETNLTAGRATGIHFTRETPASLAGAIRRALELYKDKPVWKALQNQGMACDYSWNAAAEAYMDLYRRILNRR